MRAARRPAWPSGEATPWRGSRGAPSSSSRLVGHIRIDVHIDIVNALLSLAVPAGTVPLAVSRHGVLNLRKIEATPIAFRSQPAAAFACELVDQHGLLSIFVAENVWADLAEVSLVVASDLLAIEYGPMEQPESSGG